MFSGTILLALVCAWARGGRLAALADVPLRGSVAILVAFLLPVLLQRAFDWGMPVAGAAPWLYVASLLALFGLCIWNARLPGFWLIAAGVGLNALVIAANAGRMPVATGPLLAHGAQAALAQLSAGQALTHSPLDAHSRLPFLGDIFVLTWPRLSLFSLGDLCLCAGAFWALYTLSGAARPGARRAR